LNNRSELLQFALNLSKEVGKIQLSHFGNISSVSTKSNNIDLLTIADTESENLIISKIKETYPTHSIISEERNNIINDSEYTWIIDPLDGTTNFTHNLPIFAVSIALKKIDEIVCGVVYNPAADKCFYAESGKGAFLNDKSIHPSKSNSLSDCLLATGFPYLHDEKYDLSFSIFKDFYDRTRGIRRLGAAALDLCFVAMGRFDGFYEFNLNSWDICAGSLIAYEAGCKVSDWDGNSLPHDGSRVLCTNGKIHSMMIDILSKEKYSIFY
jgi:myo-inositol-1(or 4)-monophosphatase